MKNLFDAFVEFLSIHPQISSNEKRKISDSLKNLLDADPEKEMMRRALEHYANTYNWSYRWRSVEGLTIIGMEAEEAVVIARNALACGSASLQSYFLSIYDENANNKTVSTFRYGEIKQIKHSQRRKAYALKVYG